MALISTPKRKVIYRMKNGWQLISDSEFYRFNLVFAKEGKKEKISSQLFWNLRVNNFIECIPNITSLSNQVFKLTQKGLKNRKVT